MKFYFAPMEGITGYIYRSAYHTYFGGIDKYFSPFIAPNQNRSFNSKELNDILPEHNEGMVLVPQILTNRQEDFIRTARDLKGLGYKEVNLNLGCPSRTVVAKNRGSGFLACPKELDQFLEDVFSSLDLSISIKTRIGRDDPGEFYRLIEIYNKYPLKELIIHPRIQRDYYKNQPNLQVFADAWKLSRNPVCYNGDLFTPDDLEGFIRQFPETDTVMLGRGILSDPGLICRMKKRELPEKQRYREFHDAVYGKYQKVLFGEKTVLFKMKELWSYMGSSFTNSGKYVKKIRKCEKLAAYESIVEDLFQEQEIWHEK